MDAPTLNYRGPRLFPSSLRVLRACEATVLLWSLIVCVAGSLSLYSAVSLKRHGFEIRGLNLGSERTEPVGQTAGGAPLDGALLSWHREERWGPISDNVRIAFTKDGFSRELVVKLPYRNTLNRSDHIEEAAVALAGALADVAPTFKEEHLLHSYCKAIILGGLARESGHVSDDSSLRLQAGEPARPGRVVETDYPYVSISGAHVARQMGGASLVVSLSLVVLFLAVRMIRGGQHWGRLVAATLSLSALLLVNFTYDFMVKPRDPILDFIRIVLILLTGIAPLSLSIGYALVARKGHKGRT